MVAEATTTRETDIPVFSVLKNGITIKNIFLNIPPSKQAQGDIVVVGRHPDCHIVVDHPSISRIHLNLLAKPIFHHISATDLSSVHGTWISGKRIPPNVPVDLVEGDMLRLGASTRQYMLRWVPMSRALQMENPLEAVLEEEEDTHQEDISISSPPPLLELVNPSCPDEPFPLPSMEIGIQSSGSGLLGEKEGVLLVDQTVESVNHLLLRGDEYKPEMPLERDTGPRPLKLEKKVISSSLASRRCKTVGFLQIPAVGREEEEDVSFDSAKENLIPDFSVLKENYTQLGSSTMISITALSEEDEVFPSDKENWTPGMPRDSKEDIHIVGDKFLYTNTNYGRNEWQATTTAMENLILKPSSSQKLRKSLSDLPVSSSAALVREEMFHLDSENRSPCVVRGLKSETPISDNCVNNRREQDISRNLEPGISYCQEVENLLRKLEILPSDIITPLSVSPLDREDCITVEGEEEIISYRENLVLGITSSQGLQRSNIELNESPLKVIAASTSEEESPISEIESRWGSNRNEDTCLSNKENPTSGVSLKLSSETQARIEINNARNREDSIPFQDLMDINSVNSSAAASSVNYAARMVHESKRSPRQPVHQIAYKTGGEKKQWNMVVDTECFLIEESRMALQLLKGLMGTQLIIPRIVIRELDYLKRQESWFRKRTAKASLALQWIEECMVKSSWWVHVQSSSESMPVTPTPPASPQASLYTGSTEIEATAPNSTVFFTHRNLGEIISPTTDDHILNAALLFKRIKTNGQIILLSSSTALKIKAMAEGLLCETPKEFHDSLVDSFSKRFLWTESSPRGPTWSCSDPMDLNYCHGTLDARKTDKVPERAEGLKLVLRHNSQYEQNNQ